MADITITEGDTLEVDYSLENTGDGAGTFDPRLLVQGVQEDQDTGITLDPAQTATGTLSWPTESGDAVTDALAEAVTDDTSDSITVTVEEASAIPDSVLTQDLVAWYRFEGNFADSANGSSFADSTAYDLTNNGATAATSGGVTDFDTGSDSGEVRFDQGDFLRNSAISKTLSEYSVTFWHNADDTTFNDIFAFQNDNVQPSLALRISDNRLFWTPVDDGALYQPSGVTFYGVDQYVFIALTHSSGNQTVYQDGTQIASDSQSGSATLSDLIINGRGSGSTNRQPRQLDDFRIYNRELTSSEVSDIYNATKP